MIDNEVQQDFCNVVFKNLEMETIHQPYKQELKQLHCIVNGYIELLDETLAINYSNITEIRLSKNSLRNIINLGIVVVTLAYRAAIRGGVDPEISFSLSDAYINKLDELDNIEAVNKLMCQAQREYTKMFYLHFSINLIPSYNYRIFQRKLHHMNHIYFYYFYSNAYTINV